jgi:hypothetical protein
MAISVPNTAESSDARIGCPRRPVERDDQVGTAVSEQEAEIVECRALGPPGQVGTGGGPLGDRLEGHRRHPQCRHERHGDEGQDHRIAEDLE